MSPRTQGALAALLLSAGCPSARTEPPRQEALECRLSLRGPLQGELPCQGRAWRHEGGWMISATLPERGRLAGSLELLVRDDGQGGRTGTLPGGRAHFREPGRAGVGVVWGGVPRGAVRAALQAGRPVSVEVTAVVPPLRANPEEEPVRVELRMELAPPPLLSEQRGAGPEPSSRALSPR